MRALATIDPERLRVLEGLAFDVDDTVTREGRLEGEAFEAMWALHDAGVRLVAVTGRPLGWTDVIARQWPIDAAIGENGAGWTSCDGPVVRDHYFDPESVRTGQRARLAEIAAAVARALPELELAQDAHARRCDVAYDVGERRHVGPETRAQLARVVAEHGAKLLVSSVHAHVIVGDWNKGRGITRCVADVLQLDLDDPACRARWAFIGDSGNDADAFALFARDGISIGVSNVAPHVDRLPAPPQWITERDRGLGFAELARKILEAKSRGDGNVSAETAQPSGEGGRRVPTVLVLATASVLVSVGIGAYLATRPATHTPHEELLAQVQLDTRTPERVAESFLDAWRKRRFDLAKELSRGEARAAVQARLVDDEHFPDEMRDVQKAWNVLAKERLQFVVHESEELAGARLALRGVAEGDFAGRPYARNLSFVLVAEGSAWFVEKMELGEILTEDAPLLDPDAGPNPGPGELQVHPPPPPSSVVSPGAP